MKIHQQKIRIEKIQMFINDEPGEPKYTIHISSDDDSPFYESDVCNLTEEELLAIRDEINKLNLTTLTK